MSEPNTLPASAPLPEVATVEQVAAHLQLSILTVRRMCKRGELRSVTVARRVRIPRSAVAELLGVTPPAPPEQPAPPTPWTPGDPGSRRRGRPRSPGRGGRSATT